MFLFCTQVSPDARKPPLLTAESVLANRQRVDDVTYARNAMVAARDAAKCVIVHGRIMCFLAFKADMYPL